MTDRDRPALLEYPPHPGGTFLDFCLPGTGMSIESAAEHLGIDAAHFADICHARAPITAEIALRVAMAFGSSPEAWMRMQVAHDLAVARKLLGDERIARLPELSEEEMDAWERAQEGVAEVAD